MLRQLDKLPEERSTQRQELDALSYTFLPQANMR